MHKMKNKLYTEENWFLKFDNVIVIGNYIATIIHIIEKPFLPDKPNIATSANSFSPDNLKFLDSSFGLLSK